MAKEIKDFNILVGAETGILKGVNINKKLNLSKNIHNLKALKKDFEITCMNFGDDEHEILMGLRNQTVKVYDTKFQSFSQSIETRAGDGPLVGIARYDGAILTASESGVVTFWRYENKSSFNPIETEAAHCGKLKKKSDLRDEERIKHLEMMKVGKKLSKMRQDKVQKNLVVTGGKENGLQVWDVNDTKDPLFR